MVRFMKQHSITIDGYTYKPELTEEGLMIPYIGNERETEALIVNLVIPMDLLKEIHDKLNAR